MDFQDEPRLVMHLTEAATLQEETCSPGVYTVYLCVAASWVAESKGHPIEPVEIDQATIVSFMNWEGLTLGQLAKEAGISKAMLSQVRNGKKRLSYEKLAAVLCAYKQWGDAKYEGK